MYATGTGDLFEVESYVDGISQKWEEVGKALHLLPDKLKYIRDICSDPKKRLGEVLEEFLKKNYQTEAHGVPSWRLLVIAVAHKNGGDNAGLALSIAKDHYSKSHKCLQVLIV